MEEKNQILFEVNIKAQQPTTQIDFLADVSDRFNIVCTAGFVS